MRKQILIAILLLNSLVNIAQQQVKELQVRKGLATFFNKIDKGDSVTIAYLGGSITEAAGYRVQSESLFRHLYPGIRLRTINAGIGGTGSDLAVFRLQDEVLQFHPDLVFVEFVVNDFGTDSTVIAQSIEGIVRKIKKANPATGICLLYTLSKPMLTDLREGKMVRSARVMERIADHYGLPSINFAIPVIIMLLEDRLVFDTVAKQDARGRLIFSKDGVHPLADGHQLYTSAIERSFEWMRQLKRKKPARLPDPLYASNFESANYLSPAAFSCSSGWKRISAGHPLSRFSNALPDLMYADNGLDSIIIRFNGRLLGFEDILGPSSGAANITVDGGVPLRIQRFDQYCGNSRRQYYFLKPLQEGIHTIIVKPDTTVFDKIKIVKPDELGDPAKYQANYLYVGKVLMIGTPVK